MQHILLLFSLLVAAPFAQIHAQEPLLGLGLTEGSVGFERSLTIGKELGLGFIELPIQWDDIEKEQGVYSNQFIDIANAFYPTQKISVVLSINPIDTNTLRVPKDLAGVPLDDPRCIARFKKLIDYIFSRCPQLDLTAICIGNEVDGYLQEDPKAWRAYTTFFEAINKHIKTQKPTVPVGVKITADLLCNKHAFVHGLLQHNDAIMCTYYPVKADFTVKNTDTIKEDFHTLLHLDQSRPLYLLEVGYPSHTLCHSSEQAQAAFIKLLITTWNTQQQRMPLINIVWLHEISMEEQVLMQAYYHVDTKTFAAFVGSIGLRTHGSHAKAAFKQLQESLSQMRE